MSSAKPLIVVGLPLPVFPVQEVTSLRKTGDTTGQVGNITLDSGAGMVITETVSALGPVFSLAVAPGSISLPVWQFREVPSGAINGSNAAYALAFTPVLGSEHVFLNGLLQQSGGADYGISGGVITFVAAPATGDRILVTYQSDAGSSLLTFAPSLDFSKPSNSMYLGA